MFDVRIHGRGGQGVVTAAEMLSVAAFLEGSHALAFPTFGSERTGAPVTAFCRIADRPIRSREPVVEPDALIVQDPTLLHQVDVFGGADPSAYILINTSRTIPELDVEDILDRFYADRVVTLAASDIAREHLGRALPNAALLGGLAALTRVVSIDSVSAAIQRRFQGPTGDGNVAAAVAAFALVGDSRRVAHA